METKIEKAKRLCLANGTLECEYGYWFMKPNTVPIGTNAPIEWVWNMGKKPEYIHKGIIGGLTDPTPIGKEEFLSFNPMTQGEVISVDNPPCRQCKILRRELKYVKEKANRIIDEMMAVCKDVEEVNKKADFAYREINERVVEK